jgi:hypothetical protein
MRTILRSVVGGPWSAARRRWLTRTVRVGLFVLMLAAPRAALACPVCFGQSDSPMAQGVNMGMYFLLAVVGGVLAAFASFFIYLARRARTLSAGEAGEIDERVQA